MLNHEDNLDDASLSAAQARVKTEEFAHAVASIEARKVEEARRLEGTLVLGEAISDLQLAITPEEMLAEVKQNRRLAVSANRPNPPKSFWSVLRERRFTWREVASLAVLGILIGWFSKPTNTVVEYPVISSEAQHPNSSVVIVPPAPPPTPVAAPYPPVMMPPPSPPAWAGIPLSQFPDEVQVYTTINNLTSLPHNMNPGVSTNVSVEDANSTGGHVWPLIKHLGIIYVRGWVIGQPTTTDFRRHYITLGSSRDAALYEPSALAQPRQITLRVESASWKLGTLSAGGWQTVHVRGATLDQHAYEKW